MRTNVAVKSSPVYNHEGISAKRINPIQQLRRSVLACMLWEDQFYVDGKTIAEQIAEGIRHCKPGDVATLAMEARVNYKLRHVPLLLVRELARPGVRRGVTVSDLLAAVIQRPDELAEFLALYW